MLDLQQKRLCQVPTICCCDCCCVSFCISCSRCVCIYSSCVLQLLCICIVFVLSLLVVRFHCSVSFFHFRYWCVVHCRVVCYWWFVCCLCWFEVGQLFSLSNLFFVVGNLTTQLYPKTQQHKHTNTIFTGKLTQPTNQQNDKQKTTQPPSTNNTNQQTAWFSHSVDALFAQLLIVSHKNHKSITQSLLFFTRKTSAPDNARNQPTQQQLQQTAPTTSIFNN